VCLLSRKFWGGPAIGEDEVYAWDYCQRLVSVTKRSSADAVLQTVPYEYDGLDRRIRRKVTNSAGTVTAQQRFLYDTNVLSSLLPLGGALCVASAC